MANSVNTDQTPLNAASDLGLHCLLRRSVRTLRVILVCRQTTKMLRRLTEVGKGGLGLPADQEPCQRMLMNYFLMT